MPSTKALLASLLVATGLGAQTEPPQQRPEPDPADPASEGRAEPAPAAQDPAFAELVAAVRRAHGGGDREATRSSEAALRMTTLREDEDSIEIALTAQFLAPRMLRYRVDEASETLERGFDDRGPWALVGDEVVNLSDKDFAEDRAEVRKQVRLARQLLGFLDPAKLLESLRDVAGPRPESLTIGRKQHFDCSVVDGRVDAFPLFAPPDPERPEPPCALRLWIEADSQRLLAVRATAIGDDGAEHDGPGEFLLLRDYATQRGIAVPTRLTVFDGLPPKGEPVLSITIRSIDLAPDGLTAKTMRRPG